MRDFLKIIVPGHEAVLKNVELRHRLWKFVCRLSVLSQYWLKRCNLKLSLSLFTGHKSCMPKALSNGSNMLVKHYPTLLGGVGRCLIIAGLCWMLECSNESNTIQQCWISVPGTKLWRTKMLKMLDEKFEQSQTSSNIVQQWPTCLVVLFKRVKHVASNVFGPFEQHDQTCWTMFKLFIQHRPTFSIA